ncbi:MAG: hypothetical protein HQ523_01140 [Lentisphaerae bacterium]|nr:hypothetical protein [Lentisphaerota bacterium]
MTKRERFLAFARFEAVDRVPRRASYIESLRSKVTAFLGEDPGLCFDNDEGKRGCPRPPAGYCPPDYSGYFPEFENGREGFSIDANGCGHKASGYEHFTEYISPLRHASSFSELEAYPFVDNAAFEDDEMRAACDQAHAEGDYATLFVGHMYESAWQVRGYEPFLMDLMTQPDWAEFILDKFCDNNLRTAQAAARAGYDCIMTGDDIANQNAMMFQPDLWRAIMKPRWAKVIAAARAIKPDVHIWYHTDGNAWDVLDDLVEIGIDILNPVQPECMDPLAIRKRFGKRLAFDGCIGTQTTFPFGTPDTMRRTILDLATALDAQQGGLMLSPTHVLEPEVPPENIQAFFETCDRLTADQTPQSL